MNTFLYTARQLDCRHDCRYRSCPSRFLHALKDVPLGQQIRVLLPDALFSPAGGTPLRSGDIVILTADTCQELEVLVENRDLLEQYRLVLIIDKEVYDTSRRYHLLNPRYITTTEWGQTGLGEVIRRMAGRGIGTDERGCGAGAQSGAAAIPR